MSKKYGRKAREAWAIFISTVKSVYQRMKNEYIHNQNHSINPDADGPYRRVLSGLAYMVSVAGKISGTAVFLCTGGGVPAYKKSKEISAASISGKCRNGIF